MIFQMQKIEIALSCPNFPQLDGLKVDIHQCNNSLNLHSIDLREYVETVSYLIIS